MLKDAVKWLEIVNMVSTFATPLIEQYIKDDAGDVPDWFDDALELIDRANANARAGVAFDDGLAARIRARIATMPEQPTPDDFLQMGEAIRASHGEFKAVMAARRAG